MSFSPESFDRLLADKLAQAPEPAYEPAHWDLLEDQLQHLNQALQQAAQPAAQPGAAGAGAGGSAPLVGGLAKVGFAALLTGLTAVNGYFFYAATANRQATEAAAPVATSAPAPATVEVRRPAPAPVAADERQPAPVVITRRPANRPAPAVSAPAPLQAAPAERVVATPESLREPRVLTAPVSEAAPAPAVVPAGAPANTPRPDSATAPLPAARAAEAPAGRLTLPDVPNIITPNGDGLNDRFELPVPAGTCRLTVFDRKNRVVFSAEQYTNDWDGGTLPAGQYLFLIGTPGGATPLPGVLEIKR